jgi:hypothetical protein
MSTITSAVLSQVVSVFTILVSTTVCIFTSFAVYALWRIITFTYATYATTYATYATTIVTDFLRYFGLIIFGAILHWFFSTHRAVAFKQCDVFLTMCRTTFNIIHQTISTTHANATASVEAKAAKAAEAAKIAEAKAEAKAEAEATKAVEATVNQDQDTTTPENIITDKDVSYTDAIEDTDADIEDTDEDTDAEDTTTPDDILNILRRLGQQSLHQQQQQQVS